MKHSLWRRNSKVGSFSDIQCPLRLFHHWRIYHLVPDTNRSLPLFAGDFHLMNDLYCSLYVFLCWHECRLYCSNLRGMYGLLAIKSKFATINTFFQQILFICVFEINADHVNGWQSECLWSDYNRSACVKEWCPVPAPYGERICTIWVDTKK